MANVKLLRADVLLTATIARSFERDIKPGNLQAAARNFQENGIGGHHVIRYSDGDIKDGWHWLNAVATISPKSRISVLDLD